MKIRKVSIGIQSLDDALSEFEKAAQAVSEGKKVRRTDAVNFTSLEAMRQVLTPKRIELLCLIREKAPGSVYELAAIAKRDITNVQDDVGLLSRIGLLTLKKTKSPRPRLVPRVEYDQLQLQIPLSSQSR